MAFVLHCQAICIALYFIFRFLFSVLSRTRVHTHAQFWIESPHKCETSAQIQTPFIQLLRVLFPFFLSITAGSKFSLTLQCDWTTMRPKPNEESTRSWQKQYLFLKHLEPAEYGVRSIFVYTYMYVLVVHIIRPFFNLFGCKMNRTITLLSCRKDWTKKKKIRILFMNNYSVDFLLFKCYRCIEYPNVRCPFLYFRYYFIANDLNWRFFYSSFGNVFSWLKKQSRILGHVLCDSGASKLEEESKKIRAII